MSKPKPARRLKAAPLFLRCDTQTSHLAIEMTALQSQRLSGTRHVSTGFFQFAQNVFAFGRFFHFVQAAEPIPWLARLRSLERTQRQVACFDPVLRVENYEPLH